MKKFKNLMLGLTLGLVFMSFSSFAQVTVIANGNTGIGLSNPTEKLEVSDDVKAEGFILEKTGASGSMLFHRTDASAFVMGAGVQAGFSWDEAFNFEWRTQPRANILNRQVSTGSLVFKCMGATGRIGIGRNQPVELLDVNGSIRYNGSSYNASDKRLKQNINKFTYGLDEVLQLNAVTYEYNGKADIKEAGREHVGLVAQNLQEVAPTLVKEFEHVEYADDAQTVEKSRDVYLSVNESAIKYMLINAVQQQQEIIEAKEERIANLEEKMAQLEELVTMSIANGNTSTTINQSEVTLEYSEVAELGQNRPNPFNGVTNVDYNIPTNSENASINIFNVEGKLMKTVEVDHTGVGVLTINASDIPAGTYSYQLIVDGQIIDAKKMVLAN